MAWNGLKYDANSNSLDISGSNIMIFDHVTFRNNRNLNFTGSYNTLSDKPKLGINYNFSTTTNIEELESGNISFDTRNISEAKLLNIHHINSDTINILNTIKLLHISDNTNHKSIITISDKLNYDNQIIFTIDSLNSRLENKSIFNISNVNFIGDFDSTNEIILTLSISGNQGAQGATGNQGTPGTASSAFSACLNITTPAEQIQGNSNVGGEFEIPLITNSNKPTDYSVLEL